MHWGAYPLLVTISVSVYHMDILAVHISGGSIGVTGKTAKWHDWQYSKMA